jgi:hypothetical protein
MLANFHRILAVVIARNDIGNIHLMKAIISISLFEINV